MNISPESGHLDEYPLYEVTRRIKAKMTMSFLSWYDAIEELNQVRATKKYLEQYSTFDDYIYHEFSEYGRSSIYKFLLVYEKYHKALEKLIVQDPRQLLPLSVERLYMARKVVKDDVTAEEIIRQALLCDHQDFKDNIKELSGKIASDQCNHEETEPYERCKKCGAWLKPGG